MIKALTNSLRGLVAHKYFYPLGVIFTLSTAVFTRFANLVNPKVLVFDETYYVKDAWTLGLTGSEKKWPEGYNSQFEAGEVFGFLNDPSYVVHPPVGKWVIYLGMWLFGGDSSFGWRFGTALSGVLTVLLVIVVAKRLFASSKFAILAGYLMAIEGQSIVLSRTAILDGILTFFVMLGFYFVVLDHQGWKSRLEKKLTFRPWLFMAGLALGLAAGTKWSGIYFLAAFGLYTFISDLVIRSRVGKDPAWAFAQAALNAVTLVPIALTTYVVSWWGWISSTDGWGRNAKPSWLESLWDYHLNAYSFHTGLTSEHPYQSNALQWLLSLRPTAFYFEKFDNCTFFDQCTVAITAIPNLVIWIGGLLAIFWALLRFIGKKDLTAGLIAVGFIAGWAPWLIYLSRTTFQFYAVVFTPFLVLALAYALQRYLAKGFTVGRFEQRERNLAKLVTGATVIALFFSSIWMGLEVPHIMWQIQMWFPFWI